MISGFVICTKQYRIYTLNHENIITRVHIWISTLHFAEILFSKEKDLATSPINTTPLHYLNPPRVYSPALMGTGPSPSSSLYSLSSPLE